MSNRARLRRTLLIAAVAVTLAGCGEDRYITGTVPPPSNDTREPCADHNPLRNAYFGDLHVHTSYSFDAWAFQVRTTPTDAYRFAKGEAITLPPLDANGNGTRTLRIDRPLDFAAVTDHSEFLGEVDVCTTPGLPGYDSRSCQIYRMGMTTGTAKLGLLAAALDPHRLTDICGADGQQCLEPAADVWQRIKDAAEVAYDRTSACSFTSFIAYEYTASPMASALHRNVIFRNTHVPFPTSYFEAPTPQKLWAALKADCLDAGNGCDVLAIPHNPNESNGNAFIVEYPGATTVDEERQQATFRASMEPLVEIYQNKGDSECMNGLSGVIGEPDEFCNFEKHRKPPFVDCGDGTGFGGESNVGCISRLDFVRGILLEGISEKARIGADPYRLGIIASTDTHNSTPGAVTEYNFAGHLGTNDDTPAKQLGPGNLTAGGIIFGPGGLAGVWAEENSRDSIFDALRRRETFGTSGPRITVRFFGGWGLPSDLCSDPDMLTHAYADGVPMGSILPAPPVEATAPTFLVTALRDPGTPEHPGTPLQRIQIIKGWLENGEKHQKVYDVAGDPNNGASVDTSTCTPHGSGFDSLCTVWQDPSFDPQQNAFYYVRVLENPTCRWSTYKCNSLPPGEVEPACSDPTVPKTIQERAWTSPIWFDAPQGS